jgi:hypothetical protein
VLRNRGLTVVAAPADTDYAIRLAVRAGARLECVMSLSCQQE